MRRHLLPDLNLVTLKATETDTLLTPLESYIYHHQPTEDIAARIWRHDLADLIQYRYDREPVRTPKKVITDDEKREAAEQRKALRDNVKVSDDVQDLVNDWNDSQYELLKQSLHESQNNT